ncbi:polysaccharide pyruvyl transferase family protein [uncultured Bacteroides sp.]|uniref:polysaccharide pyruvyl transferase family protein n=1 Tax=uncultured Bacteroides sp. TaxID=162156 RepID=UPI002AA80953|nr:polysaccharide pyruvyl transferase family protein [uncultured Bacteroides sp.]
MKIGILTHPQGANYGGVLQCYALSTFLKKMGHTPVVIRREGDKSFFLWEWTRALLRILHCPRYYTPDKIDITFKIRSFINSNFLRTYPVRSQKRMRSICKDYDLQAVIVGSDQVWRQDFAMNFGYNYYLDFVSSNVTKVSYAASFGLSEWTYTTSQTLKIKDLLSLFKGISVREEDGVDLCKNNLGITPELLIDPTLLLSVEDYDKFTSPRLIKEKYIFIYWLGDKSLVQNEIDKFKSEGYEIIDVNLRDDIELPAIEDWLSYIKYADKVITDSFHGCVFSTIYNRQFIVHCNKSGGFGRLQSLFNSLQMQEKLNAGNAIVEYTKVNNCIVALQEIAFNYLNKTLI